MTTQPAARPRLLQAMVDAFRQEDVRRKLLFTLAMLVVFRFVAHVPVPNVDRTALENAFKGNAILDFLSIFSGGALQNLSVAALGVYPFITASIIMQILTPLVPALRSLQEEGEQGNRRIQLYTHWLAVPMAFVRATARSCSSMARAGTSFGTSASKTTRWGRSQRCSHWQPGPCSLSGLVS